MIWHINSEGILDNTDIFYNEGTKVRVLYDWDWFFRLHVVKDLIIKLIKKTYIHDMANKWWRNPWQRRNFFTMKVQRYRFCTIAMIYPMRLHVVKDLIIRLQKKIE